MIIFVFKFCVKKHAFFHVGHSTGRCSFFRMTERDKTLTDIFEITLTGHETWTSCLLKL